MNNFKLPCLALVAAVISGCAHKFTPEEDASINLEADSYFKSVAASAFIDSCANSNSEALTSASTHIATWKEQYKKEIENGYSFMRLLQNSDGSYVNYTPELTLSILRRPENSEPKEFYQEPLCAHVSDVYRLKTITSEQPK